MLDGAGVVPGSAHVREDLASASVALAELARLYRLPRIALYSENPRPVTDPLWRGWVELNARRAEH